jgi:ABC-type polysaccharide/polyol phosphate export permease
VTATIGVYADLLRYRELFASLFRRDLRAKYRGSALGLAWSIANPLALMGIYFLVFAVLWRVADLDHYALYLLAGLAMWIFFATSLQAASRSMIDYSELIKKVRFPRQLVAFSVVAAQLVTFAVMLGILIVVSLITVPRARDTVWLSLPLAALFVGLVFGVALAVASANVVFRDVEHILAAVLLPWFFLTPVLYRFESISGFQRHHTIVEVLRWGNFVTPPVYALRDTIWRGELPRAGDVIYLAAAALIALAVGAFVFTRVDDRIAVEL